MSRKRDCCANTGIRSRRSKSRTAYPDSVAKKIGMAVDCVWSRRWHSEFRALLQKSRPDVVHIHNFFPRISPSIYYACRREGVPVVQTLHNYRLLCAGAELVSQWKSLRGMPGSWRPARRSVRLLSGIEARHRGSHADGGCASTRADLVEYGGLLHCADRISRGSKLIAGGLPADRIRVKPNFVLPDPGARERRWGIRAVRRPAGKSKGVPDDAGGVEGVELDPAAHCRRWSLPGADREPSRRRGRYRQSPIMAGCHARRHLLR